MATEEDLRQQLQLARNIASAKDAIIIALKQEHEAEKTELEYLRSLAYPFKVLLSACARSCEVMDRGCGICREMKLIRTGMRDSGSTSSAWRLRQRRSSSRGSSTSTAWSDAQATNRALCPPCASSACVLLHICADTCVLTSTPWDVESKDDHPCCRQGSVVEAQGAADRTQPSCRGRPHATRLCAHAHDLGMPAHGAHLWLWLCRRVGR